MYECNIDHLLQTACILLYLPYVQQIQDTIVQLKVPNKAIPIMTYLKYLQDHL